MLLASKVVRKEVPTSTKERVARMGLKGEKINSCVKELTEFVQENEFERCKGLKKFHWKHLDDLKSGV